MALMQIAVIPIGTTSPGVSGYVADIEQFLRDKGVEHTLNDMGTVVAGTTHELLQIAHEVHQLPFTKGAERVITNITIDERRDCNVKLGDKHQSVMQQLKHKQK